MDQICVSGEARCRITRLEVLHVKAYSTTPVLKKVLEADTGINAICPCICFIVVKGIRAAEVETAVDRLQGRNARTFGAACFESDPRLRGLADSQIYSTQSVFGVLWFIPAGGQANFNMVIEPVMKPAAGCQLVWVIKPWGVFIIDHQINGVAAD